MINYWRLLKTWQRLKSFQYRDIQDIRNYQLVRFKKLIQHAYQRVPMYREFYDSHSFKPPLVRDYDDIEKVPVISKNIIHSFPLKKRVDSHVSEKDVLKESTSGSTGEPLEIWSDGTEGFIQSMKCIRFLREWGYSVFDNTVQLWREVYDPKKSVIQQLGLLKRQHVSFMDDVDKQIRKIVQYRCDVLFSSRSSLEILADELTKRGVKIRPRILVSGCEVLTEEHRQLFRKTFNCNTLEIYGCNETGNIAWECPNVSNAHNLHIDMETVVVNFRDITMMTDSKRVGSIVVTNLENYVMPFIRYDLGDLILLPESNKCSCGRTLPVLGKVLGRNDDIIQYNERMFNWHFFYNYFKDYSYIHKYKIVQTKTNDIEFRIHLSHDTEDSRKRCLSDLSSAFSKHFPPLNIRFVKRFAVSPTGKFKVIEREA